MLSGFLNPVNLKALILFTVRKKDFVTQNKRYGVSLSIMGVALSLALILASGVEYTEFTCGENITLKAVTRKPDSEYHWRLIDNPTVKRVDQNPYSGQSIPEWLIQKTKKNHRKIVAAVNGNFFGEFHSPKGPYKGYRSTGFLYSDACRPKVNSPLRITPLKDWGIPNAPIGGDVLIISENQKISHHSLKPVCTDNTQTNCKIVMDDSEPLSPNEFSEYFIRNYPKAEYAMQLFMPLKDLKRFECTPQGKPRNCKRTARTVFCVEADQSVSLITTDFARIEEMAKILHDPKIQCAKKCVESYNLDGGGSTQISILNPTTKKWEQPIGGTQPRPVQNFFILEKHDLKTKLSF
jgi:hypothetical protein